MNKLHHKYLLIMFLTALILSGLPTFATAAAGKVEFASGGATLQSLDGTARVMTKGMEINQGDTILTGGGRAQVKFTDGGYFSFQPNTEFKVEEYNFNGKLDGSEKGFFKLLRGGLRAITGFVGRENKPAYRLGTPVATIGIRGTYYLAEFNENLKTHVGQGSIYIFNEFGDIILFKGQGAEVRPGSAPKYSDEEMTIGTRGPEGAQPDDVKTQQLAEIQNNNVFKASEQYSDDGIACLNGDCGISSAISNLNGIGASATYRVDDSAANTGGGMGWTSKVSHADIGANFSDYTMSGDIGIQSSKGGTQSPNGGTITLNVSEVSSPIAYDQFTVNGSMLKSGGFALSGTANNYNQINAIAVDGPYQPTGSVCGPDCKINIVGFFNGDQADKANIGYVINGVTDGGNTGQITGTAGIIVQSNDGGR